MLCVNEAVNQVYYSITHNQHKLGIFPLRIEGVIFAEIDHDYHNKSEPQHLVSAQL